MLLRRSSWFLVLVSLGGLGGVIACGDTEEHGAGPAVPSGASNTATLSSRSEALSREATDAAVVSPGQLIFPATFAGLLAKQPGDVLVGERQRKVPGASVGNPEGFLRKVRSVKQQGDLIVIDTDPASLTEAFEQLSFRASMQGPALTEHGPVGELNPDGPGYLPQKEGKAIDLLNFSGKSLFDVNEGVDIDGKNLGFHAYAKVDTGFLKFTPSYDIGADVDPPKIGLDGIKLPKLKSFHASATGTLDAQLVVVAGLKLNTDIDSATFTKILAQKLFKSKDANLADFNFDLGSVKAGPISIPINASLKAVLACDFDWKGGAEVKYGGKSKASVTVGLKYENDEIKPSFDKSFSFEQIGPNYTLDGLIRVKCSITPTVQLKLWDLGSAEVWAKGYAGIAGSLTCDAPSGNPPTQKGHVKGEAVAGIRAGVKANLNLLGLIKYNKECTLFDLNTKADFNQSFDLPGGDNKGASCAGSDLPFQLEEPPAPEKCFGSGSGNGNGGSGNGGGLLGNGCKPGVNDVPSDWTCDAKKWNDCKCDCNCGAKDADCKDGECAGCDHDECTAGTALGSKCNSCTQKVCEAAPYCCEEKWGISCFASVEKLCGKKCQ